MKDRVSVQPIKGSQDVVKILKTNKAEAGYQRIKLRPDGERTLAELALNDMRAFATLINLQGGWGNFAQCHDELVSFLTTPQDRDVLNRLKWEKDERDAKLRRLCLMPRGHLKSTINTVLYTLWRIYRNPNIRILVGTNKQSLSFGFIRELRTYLENEELQDKVWNNRPHYPKVNLIPVLDKRNRERNRNSSEENDSIDKKLIWNTTALQVVRDQAYKEPTVFAASVGTTVTGQHYDLIILDDVVDFKNTESEIKKERVNEWIADLESILNPYSIVELPGGILDVVGGEMVISGTRYALDDYYGFLLENEEALMYASHCRNIYKNGVDASDGYLWEDRFGDKTVAALKARLSPRRFSSQYLNAVYEKDSRLFQVDSVPIIDDDRIFTLGKQVFWLDPEGSKVELYPVIAVDPAFSTGRSGDDCAILVGSKTPEGKLIVIDASLDRMTAAEVCETILRFANKWNTLRVYHEENGVGMLLPDLLKAKEMTVQGRPLFVSSFWEQRTKEAKIQGVLELPVARGNVAVCQRIRNNVRAWNQFRNYPAVSHDDFMDGLCTLYEKAVPSKQRKKKDDSPRFTLNLEYKLDNIAKKQTQRSLLSEFNSYFE